jgi:glycosyltransferase involved in cell wall biosynthesis
VPVICTADVGVVPIYYDSFTKYMLPVKLLEYVALKIPTICSRTETIQSYFDDSMVKFFNPGSIDELTEIILFLYQNPEKRKQLAVDADKFNREYNWNQQKQLLYSLVDELCAKSN